MKIALAPSLVLSDEHAGCRYGAPVLVKRSNPAQVFGPADVISVYRQLQPAAMVVHRFAKTLAGDELETARAFLRQWPEGPQL